MFVIVTVSYWTRKDTIDWQGGHWRPVGSCRPHRCA